MTANEIVTAIEWVQVNGKVAPDCRRVLNDERFSLLDAMKSKDAAAIKAAMNEALRVARMWSVDLSHPMRTDSI